MSKEVIKTVGAILINSDKVLLVRHKEKARHITGVYGMPGGRIESDETSLQTAVREVAEETGLTVIGSDFQPVGTYVADIERSDGNTKRFSIDVFVTNRFDGEIKESDETKPEWIEVSKLDDYSLLPNVEKAAKEGLEKLK